MAILKRGSRGQEVKNLQAQINAIGYNLKADGIFGKGTETAVKSIQAGAGLVVDGIAGPKTVYAIKNAGDKHADHLSESDLVAAAQTLGVELASIKAVHQVESRGTGFTKTGNLKTLFERHIMHRQLTATIGASRTATLAAMYSQLVNPTPGGYQGGDAEIDRLAGAVNINTDCAYNSASYGMYQVMGFNHEVCGYPTAQSMHDAFVAGGEDAQLAAFVKFIQDDDKMWDCLKTKDWAGFARHYNGPAYAKNQYDVKLEKAYKSFS